MPPSFQPTSAPTSPPPLDTDNVTSVPTSVPSRVPTAAPTQEPTSIPTWRPTPATTPVTEAPTSVATSAPTSEPPVMPTFAPTPVPERPTPVPTSAPTTAPVVPPATSAPTSAVTVVPTPVPTQVPTKVPTEEPEPMTAAPTSAPTYLPSIAPSSAPTPVMTSAPTSSPSLAPTIQPTVAPTFMPEPATPTPTSPPTSPPTLLPSPAPTHVPTPSPSGPTPATSAPTSEVTLAPAAEPTLAPTETTEPTSPPTSAPTDLQPVVPTPAPTHAPTQPETGAPKTMPTPVPTTPTPSAAPTESPSMDANTTSTYFEAVLALSSAFDFDPQRYIQSIAETSGASVDDVAISSVRFSCSFTYAFPGADAAAIDGETVRQAIALMNNVDEDAVAVEVAPGGSSGLRRLLADILVLASVSTPEAALADRVSQLSEDTDKLFETLQTLDDKHINKPVLQEAPQLSVQVQTEVRADEGAQAVEPPNATALADTLSDIMNTTIEAEVKNVRIVISTPSPTLAPTPSTPQPTTVAPTSAPSSAGNETNDTPAPTWFTAAPTSPPTVAPTLSPTQENSYTPAPTWVQNETNESMQTTTLTTTDAVANQTTTSDVPIDTNTSTQTTSTTTTSASTTDETAQGSTNTTNESASTTTTAAWTTLAHTSTTTTATTTWTTAAAEVHVEFLLQNMDYGRLLADMVLSNNFEAAVKEVLAMYAGWGTTSDDIQLALRSGSVQVDAAITPPAGISATTLDETLRKWPALDKAIQDAVLLVPDISSALSGELGIAGLSILLAAADGNSQSTTRLTSTMQPSTASTTSGSDEPPPTDRDIFVEEDEWSASSAVALALVAFAGVLQIASLSNLVEESVNPSRLLFLCLTRRISWLRASCGIDGVRGGHMPILGQRRPFPLPSLERWRYQAKDGAWSAAWSIHQHGKQLLVEAPLKTEKSFSEGPLSIRLSQGGWNDWASCDAPDEPVSIRYKTASRLYVTDTHGRLCKMASISAKAELTLSLDMVPTSQRLLGVLSAAQFVLALLTGPGLAGVSIGGRMSSGLTFAAQGVVVLLAGNSRTVVECLTPQGSKARLAFVMAAPLLCSCGLWLSCLDADEHPDIRPALMGASAALWSPVVLFFESSSLGFLLAFAVDVCLTTACGIAGAVVAVMPLLGLTEEPNSFVTTNLLTHTTEVVGLMSMVLFGATRLYACVALHPYSQPLRAPTTADATPLRRLSVAGPSHGLGPNRQTPGGEPAPLPPLVLRPDFSYPASGPPPQPPQADLSPPRRERLPPQPALPALPADQVPAPPQQMLRADYALPPLSEPPVLQLQSVAEEGLKRVTATLVPHGFNRPARADVGGGQPARQLEARKGRREGRAGCAQQGGDFRLMASRPASGRLIRWNWHCSQAADEAVQQSPGAQESDQEETASMAELHPHRERHEGSPAGSSEVRHEDLPTTSPSMAADLESCSKAPEEDVAVSSGSSTKMSVKDTAESFGAGDTAAQQAAEHSRAAGTEAPLDLT
eukprot:TRINITY_DN6945_c0_g1_i7.p1 TRINITY_DN6945_c0_g1~~TRINITY_DN6945_c0_g1_i7.p1  ORF type:complete len:1502 (+),score=255.64 TRINITY_DN6945_c0_g1_i7:600-5105(+)